MKIWLLENIMKMVERKNETNKYFLHENHDKKYHIIII